MVLKPSCLRVYPCAAAPSRSSPGLVKVFLSELGYPSGLAWRKTTPILTGAAPSPPRSRCSRRRAPRSASCRHPAGPGSLELTALTTRRLGSIRHLPRAVLVPSDHDYAADDRRRHSTMYYVCLQGRVLCLGCLRGHVCIILPNGV